jgi:hypothetical protein
MSIKEGHHQSKKDAINQRRTPSIKEGRHQSKKDNIYHGRTTLFTGHFLQKTTCTHAINPKGQCYSEKDNIKHRRTKSTKEHQAEKDNHQPKKEKINYCENIRGPWVSI